MDAVAPGDTLRLELAEELERLKPFGSGNPAVSPLVPSALLDDPRPMGEGRHVGSLAAGGARSRCVLFGKGSSLPAAPGEPVDAAVRLEANRYNGTTEPRLILRCAQPAAPSRSSWSASRRGSTACRLELDRDLDGPSSPWAAVGADRSLRDQLGIGVAGLLGTASDAATGTSPRARSRSRHRTPRRRTSATHDDLAPRRGRRGPHRVRRQRARSQDTPR